LSEHVNGNHLKVFSQVRNHLAENSSTTSESVKHEQFWQPVTQRLDGDLVDEVLAVWVSVQVDVFNLEV
jgi:hypothetical protein